MTHKAFLPRYDGIGKDEHEKALPEYMRDVNQVLELIPEVAVVTVPIVGGATTRFSVPFSAKGILIVRAQVASTGASLAVKSCPAWEFVDATLVSGNQARQARRGASLDIVLTAPSELSSGVLYDITVMAVGG